MWQLLARKIWVLVTKRKIRSLNSSAKVVSGFCIHLGMDQVYTEHWSFSVSDFIYLGIHFLFSVCKIPSFVNAVPYASYIISASAFSMSFNLLNCIWIPSLWSPLSGGETLKVFFTVIWAHCCCLLWSVPVIRKYSTHSKNTACSLFAQHMFITFTSELFSEIYAVPCIALNCFPKQCWSISSNITVCQMLDMKTSRGLITWV